MRIFVSYTVRDGWINRDRLRRLALPLEGFSVPYVDLLEHKCGGHQPSVWSALGRMDAFLLCLTPHVFRSPWVIAEYAIAIASGVPIYTLNFDDWITGDIAIHQTMAPSSLTKPRERGFIDECNTLLDPKIAREFNEGTLPHEGAKTAPFNSMCGPHFYSVRSAEDVRTHAAEQGISDEETVAMGMGGAYISSRP